MQHAHVASIEGVVQFRADCIRFGQDAREALINQDLELRRAMTWLLDDQPAHWRHEIRQAEDAVLEAKADLLRCRGMTLPDGRTPSCMEERVALDRARRRQEHAEEKSKATEHWGHAMEHEVVEYSSRISQLQEALEALPQAIGMLDRVLAALEAYTEVKTPEAAQPAPSADEASSKESKP